MSIKLQQSTLKKKNNPRKRLSFEVLAETLGTRIKIRLGEESNAQTKMPG